MKCFRFLLAILCSLFLNSSLFAQSTRDRTQSDPSGDWVLTTGVYGENLSERLTLKLEKGELSGTLFRDEGAALKGTLKGQELLQFTFKESGGDQSEYKGRISGDALAGEYTSIGANGEIGRTCSGICALRRLPRACDLIPLPLRPVRLSPPTLRSDESASQSAGLTSSIKEKKPSASVGWMYTAPFSSVYG